VVTGIGVVAPNGIGKDAFWASLLEGRSGVGPITLFDATDTPCKAAGEVRDFKPTDFIDPAMKPRRMSRCTQLAVAAARLALEDSGLEAAQLARHFPMPLVMGVSTSAPDMWEQHHLQIEKRGAANGPPYIIGAFMPHAAVNAISACLGLQTQPLTMSSACAAGMDAVGAATEQIQSGRADVAMAGGADAPISYTAFTSFAACGLISADVTDPRTASRPFDRRRVCGVISEGAAVVVLENMNHARARGARPYLEIKGYAMNADPDPGLPGSGLAGTMKMALANAGRHAARVDYVNAHGPGHPVLDRVETNMIKAALGQRASRIPVSSIKGHIGNPLAAGGVLQLAACALIIRHRRIPPTANLEEPDPACDLDYVAGRPRAAVLDCVVINSHGLGGRNGSMVVERIAPE